MEITEVIGYKDGEIQLNPLKSDFKLRLAGIYEDF